MPVIVCLSSWTADEDFDILLCGAAAYDRQSDAAGPLPKLLVLITGQGPLRKYFESRIANLHFRHITFRTLWLVHDDYHLLLRIADLGLCFHRSSSGVDLTMKIADMFGAALPVCAYDYGQCLGDIMEAGHHGVLFNTGDDLDDRLGALLATFPRHTPMLDTMRRAIGEDVHQTWEQDWHRVAWPIFRRLFKSIARIIHQTTEDTEQYHDFDKADSSYELNHEDTKIPGTALRYVPACEIVIGIVLRNTPFRVLLSSSYLRD